MAAECGSPEIGERVARAIAEIQQAVDPCGDTDEIHRVLDEFRRCDPSSYRICIDPRSSRNFVDPGIRDQPAFPTSLTWNPELRTELESSCNGAPTRPVRRDPTASLLHEIVHIVQDCDGLDPGAHESDAVRIENIYRRARGLCQRSRYGERVLPSNTFVACGDDACGCPRSVPFSGEKQERGDMAAMEEKALDPLAAGDTLPTGPGDR